MNWSDSFLNRPNYSGQIGVRPLRNFIPMSVILNIYDSDWDCIGMGELTAAKIKAKIDAAKGKDIDVHICSGGGSVFDGWAIYNALKAHDGKVTCYVDAIAASIASVIALAGSKVVMSKASLMMIHKPSSITWGDADAMKKDAEFLDTIQDTLVDIYCEKTGLERDVINQMVDDETWMTPEQALQLKFIDEIAETESETNAENAKVVDKYTAKAPVLIRQYVNSAFKQPKINNNKTTETNMEVSKKQNELLEKNNSLMTKILNFFKSIKNEMVDTDKGQVFYDGQLGTGTEVFSDEAMTIAAEDGEYKTQDGDQFTVESGVVTAFTEEEGEEEENKDGEDGKPANADEETETAETEKDKAKNEDGEGEETKPMNSANYKKIVAENAALKAESKEKDALLAEAKIQLELANAEISKTREEIKNEIKSTFTPKGSNRSTKGEKEDKGPKDAAPDLMPKSDVAKNAMKMAINASK